MKEKFVYQMESDLAVEAFRDLLVRSTLGPRRPIDDTKRLALMLAHADLIVTARVSDGTLIGISRAITDFAFCCYLSDLAVDAAYQGRGIGRALIAETHERAGPGTTLYLVSAPAAETYYPHIGLTHVPACWKRSPSP